MTENTGQTRDKGEAARPFSAELNLPTAVPIVGYRPHAESAADVSHYLESRPRP